MKNKSLYQWQKFIAEIRSWDRKEHNWHEQQKRQGALTTNNLVTKTDLIHSLMKKYKLTRKS